MIVHARGTDPEAEVIPQLTLGLVHPQRVKASVLLGGLTLNILHSPLPVV